METSLMRHSNAIAARAANSTALRFSTGKAPGSPRQTGHTFVLGGSPKRVEHEQKIFDAVSNCTWTSSPMTGSYFARRSSETAGVVAIPGDYSWPRWWTGETSLCRNPEDSKKVEHATTPAAKRRQRKARHVSAGKESGTRSSPGGTAHWLRHRLETPSLHRQGLTALPAAS